MQYLNGVTLGDLIAPKNHRKFIVIGQIIGSGKIDPFTQIKSVIASISIFNYRKFIAHRLNFRFKLNFLVLRFSGQRQSLIIHVYLLTIEEL